jgi:hypothetical protein
MRAFSFRTLIAAAACAAFAAPVFADGLHIRVGDLSQPSAARDFDQQLTAAAHRFCANRFSPMELNQKAACEAAVRAEGLDQLGDGQREALAHALGPASRLARRGAGAELGG